MLRIFEILVKLLALIVPFFAGNQAAKKSEYKKQAKVKDAQLKEAANPRNRATTTKRMRDKSF